MIDKLRIIVLVDNNAEPGLLAEHGLALWVETPDLRIIFDTGQTEALLHNAQKLGVPLEKADYIVISHGHYDHTGGLKAVLRLASHARLIIGRDSLKARYSIGPERGARMVGVPQAVRLSVEALEPGRVIWTDGPFRFSDSMGVTGPIPRETDYEDEGGAFFLDTEGLVRDVIPEDQALWIDTPLGLVICAGCSHAGLVNSISFVGRMKDSGGLHLVLGGFHLVNADSLRLTRTVEALRYLSPRLLAPCHCTGESAVAQFLSAFGEANLLRPKSGFQWSFPNKNRDKPSPEIS